MSVVPQLINVGLAPNDGTGDRPRPMAMKYNATVTALAAAINAGVTGVSINGGHIVITKADGSSTDIGIVGGTVNGGVAGSTLVQLPTLTAAGNLLLAGSDTTGNLGGLTLTALLAWLVAQSPDISASPQVNGVLTGDLLPLIRNGMIVLVPASATTAPSSGSSGGGTTTPTVATTFAVNASPSTVSVGSSVILTITPGSGGWPNGEVVTPSVTGVSGTFDQTTKTGVGTNAVTFVFTASSAGTATLSASANGMNLSGSPATVTVSAQNSGASQPALVLSNPTFADRGDGSNMKMLTGGTGTVSVVLPSNKQWVIKVKARATKDYSYDGGPWLKVSNQDGQIYAAFRNRAQIAYDTGGGAGNDPAPFTITDGQIHDFAIETPAGGGENSYIDGSNVPNGNRVSVYAVGGSVTIDIDAGSNPTLIAGIFDIRVYSGSMSALGPLLYEWQLNGNGS